MRVTSGHDLFRDSSRAIYRAAAAGKSFALFSKNAGLQCLQKRLDGLTVLRQCHNQPPLMFSSRDRPNEQCSDYY
jgi:hypothetical protein